MGIPYKMKNSALNMSAKKGTAIFQKEDIYTRKEFDANEKLVEKSAYEAKGKNVLKSGTIEYKDLKQNIKDRRSDYFANYNEDGTKKGTAGANKLAEAKKNVQGAKDMIVAYVEPGKATKAGGSIYEDKYEGTGETRASKRAGRKIAKAEKKITRAGELYAKGKTKRADRKVKSADKKTTKARKIISKRGSGTTTRSVQEKYKNDPRYQD